MGFFCVDTDTGRFQLFVRVRLRSRAAPNPPATRCVEWAPLRARERHGRREWPLIFLPSVSDSLLRAPVHKEDKKDSGDQNRAEGEPLKPRSDRGIGLEGSGFLEKNGGQHHGVKGKVKVNTMPENDIRRLARPCSDGSSGILPWSSPIRAAPLRPAVHKEPFTRSGAGTFVWRVFTSSMTSCRISSIECCGSYPIVASSFERSGTRRCMSSNPSP